MLAVLLPNVSTVKVFNDLIHDFISLVFYGSQRNVTLPISPDEDIKYSETSGKWKCGLFI